MRPGGHSFYSADMERRVLKTNPLISRDDVAALHDKLFRWCLSRCGSDRELAEDLMQQTYVEVISGSAQFRGDSTLQTFLFGVAHNLSRSHYKKAAARARLAQRSAQLEATAAHDAECDNLEIDAARLWHSVQELSDRQRDVIELVFCNDMTIEEAAAVMQVSLGTARQHYSRAKDALAKKLSEMKSEVFDQAPTRGAANE